ncbi:MULTISPECIES: hypothetical protein [Cryobacterium]|uniref:DUF308 domain-containing protein n=1 Tax=Cryobacterium breve TaxID=1259258 RepID=A0ABY2J0Z5_9MICO|nr:MULTISPECIES: hypothetical protein [Cryobacterium]TFC96000.1 hypothetical protein E3T20_04600 [Cryobacterium sp. TmT3-12]TFC97972.1 hypothetical protein E3O65_09645 [Cryobacterium breve]
MTETPDSTREPGLEPEQEPTREPTLEPEQEPDRWSDPPPDPPVDGQPMDAITSVISITTAPGPAEPDGHSAEGTEVEVETADSAVDYTVAYPSPIPEYALEPTGPTDSPSMIVPGTGEPPSRVLASDGSEPAPALPAASVRPRSRPLLGTIVWGVILLALAGYVLLGVLVPTPADPTLWLLGGVILIGLLLIVVGIIAALRRVD